MLISVAIFMSFASEKYEILQSTAFKNIAWFILCPRKQMNPNMMSQQLQDTHALIPILLCSVITCLGFLVLFCSEILRLLSASPAAPCSLTILILHFLLPFFLLTQCRRFLGEASWFRKLSLSPLPVLLQHCTTWWGIGHQGSSLWATAWASPLLHDLSPSLVYIYLYIDRHAQKAGCYFNINTSEFLWNLFGMYLLSTAE